MLFIDLEEQRVAFPQQSVVGDEVCPEMRPARDLKMK